MFLISYMYTYIIIGFMDLGKQISRAFWHGMVKLVIRHQTGQEPVYGGKLSKYLRNQAHEISPGSLSPLLNTLEKANLLHSRIRIFKGRARKYYELNPQGQICLDVVRRNLAKKSGRLS